MNDRSDPAEALFGMNSQIVPRPIHSAEATSKRKFDDSIAVDAPLGCQLCKVDDQREELNSSLTRDIKSAAISP
eukprot:scaffold2637_cov46-Cyclotella_meneghiniana.AAC.1